MQWTLSAQGPSRRNEILKAPTNKEKLDNLGKIRAGSSTERGTVDSESLISYLD